MAKLNLRNLKNFKQGIMSLTPLQLSVGKISGYAGMILGITMAGISMLIQHSWGLGIFMIFLAWFQLMGLIGEFKSYKGLKEMERTMEGI